MKPRAAKTMTLAGVANSNVWSGLRKVCLSLPETAEVMAWGHPTFRVGGKIFVGFGQQAGRRCIAVKVGKERQKELLKDPRYLFSDYVGKYGWVTLTLEHELDWEEIGGLVLTSYRAIAPARILREMEGEAGPAAIKRPIEKSGKKMEKRVEKKVKKKVAKKVGERKLGAKKPGVKQSSSKTRRR